MNSILIALGSSAVIRVITEILYVAGLWKVLVKCGLRGWRALIPYYRDYSLSETVNMEAEGMVCMFTGFFALVGQIVLLFVAPDSTIEDLVNIFLAVLSLVGVVYRFRILRVVAVMFQVKTRFLILWIPFQSIVFCILGFGKKYEPAWKAEDSKKEA